MESWEVLEDAIPRTASKRVAQVLSICPDYVRRWRREPESDDAPTATGQRSILDRVCDLIDAVFLVNPKGAGLIVHFINSHYRRLMRTHSKPIDTFDSRTAAAADLLTEAVEAVNRLNIEGCTDDTLRELIQLRNAADHAIQRVQTSIGGTDETENY